MNNNIFNKIVKGEIPAHKVYEDDDVLAFLDIAPINKGHILVIPKQNHISLTTVPDEIVAKMMVVAKKIGNALMRLKEYDGFNLHLNNGECAGQTVPHCHIHVIPRVGNDGFSFGWRAKNYQSQQEAKEYLEIIKNEYQKL